MKKAMSMVAVALLLAACGERAQTIGGAKQDAEAYNGTGTAFQLPGWKPGDKASWESQLRARGQNSQNEYNRVN